MLCFHETNIIRNNAKITHRIVDVFKIYHLKLVSKIKTIVDTRFQSPFFDNDLKIGVYTSSFIITCSVNYLLSNCNTKLYTGDQYM